MHILIQVLLVISRLSPRLRYASLINNISVCDRPVVYTFSRSGMTPAGVDRPEGYGPNNWRTSALFRRIRDHRILCPGVRGRATGVVGRMFGPGILWAGDGTAWWWVGARGVSVCVARVVFLGEILRGSGLGEGSFIGMRFQAGCVVPGIGGNFGDLVLLGGDPEGIPPFGCSGGGRSRVGRP